MKLTFLGTSSMLPTHDRNHSAIFLEYKEQGILIDCGEGTQRQLRIAGIKPSKLSKILITHFHGDHVLGIPGVIQNLSAHNYSKTLEIYGPKGTKASINHLLSGIIFQGKIQLKIKELSQGIFYKNKDFQLEAKKLNHGNVPCIGYSFKEADKLKINTEYLKKFNLTQHPILKQLQAGKSITWQGKKIPVKQATLKNPGKKLAFILDTRYCQQAIALAKNSSVIIAESTWLEKEKKSQGFHLSAKDAALIAKKSKSNQLILTHFSQKYKSLEELEKEAKEIFSNTIMARDFLTLEI